MKCFTTVPIARGNVDRTRGDECTIVKKKFAEKGERKRLSVYENADGWAVRADVDSLPPARGMTAVAGWRPDSLLLSSLRPPPLLGAPLLSLHGGRGSEAWIRGNAADWCQPDQRPCETFTSLLSSSGVNPGSCMLPTRTHTRTPSHTRNTIDAHAQPRSLHLLQQSSSSTIEHNGCRVVACPGVANWTIIQEGRKRRRKRIPLTPFYKWDGR